MVGLDAYSLLITPSSLARLQSVETVKGQLCVEEPHDLVVLGGVASEDVAKLPARRTDQCLFQDTFEWSRRSYHAAFSSGIESPAKLGPFRSNNEQLQAAFGGPTDRGVDVVVPKPVADHNESCWLG